MGKFRRGLVKDKGGVGLAVEWGQNELSMSSAAPQSSRLERIRVWWSRKRALERWCLIAFALMLGGSVVLLARPAYRWAKQVRAAHLVSGLAEARDEASLLRAVQDAHAAYQLAPHHPPVIRAMAELYAAINLERSLGFWQALADHPEATDEDRRAFVRAMLTFRRPEAAAVVLSKLLQARPEDVELRKLRAQWHHLRGQTDEALAVLREITRDHPGDASAALALAVLLARLPDEGGAAEAKALLLEAMKDDGPDGLAALEMLSRRFALSEEEVREVVARVQSHPQAAGSRRLWLSELELRRQPERRERIINAVVAEHRGAGPGEVARAGRWLNQQGASAAVPEIIPLDLALTRQDLFLIWADSMALQKRWGELREVLGDARVPIDRDLAVLFRARAARELGDRREEDALWTRALSAVSGRPEMLWYMARYAERLGDYERAAQVYQALARALPDPRQAWLSLIRLYEMSGDTQALAGVLAAMVEKYPHDRAVRNDLAYLRLLFNQDVEVVATEALERVGAEPRIMAYRVTAALALLRTGRAEEARRLLDDSGIRDWSGLQPGWQAVRVAVLGAAGDRAAARAAALAIPAGRLKPEEHALVVVWR